MYSFKQGNAGHLIPGKQLKDYIEDHLDDEEMVQCEEQGGNADDMDV